MVCPKCKSEIGNQPSCPYCGQTVMIPGQSRQRTTVAIDPRIQQQNGGSNRLSRQLNGIEMRTKLALILSVGTFVLQILILLVIILK